MSSPFAIDTFLNTTFAKLRSSGWGGVWSTQTSAAMAEVNAMHGLEGAQSAMLLEESTASMIRVFPNPSAGNINIEIQGLAMEAAEYIVHDNLGNEIFRGVSNSSISLNFISSGTYSIQVVTENEVLIEKIIVLK